MTQKPGSPSPRGLGGEGRLRQKAHSGDVLEKARDLGWGCSVSWETQKGKELSEGSWSQELMLAAPFAPGLEEDAGTASVFLPGGTGWAGRELLLLVLPVGRSW